MAQTIHVPSEFAFELEHVHVIQSSIMYRYSTCINVINLITRGSSISNGIIRRAMSVIFSLERPASTTFKPATCSAAANPTYKRREDRRKGGIRKKEW